MDFQHRVMYLLLALPAFVAAFTIHEFAHAYTAHRLGDDTAKNAGKMSLDPLKMLDPIGSSVLVISILLGGPLLGWASVPVNRSNLRKPNRDDSLVSVAGPVSNVAQALVWFVLLVALRLCAQAAGFEFGTQAITAIVNNRPDLSSAWLAFAMVCAIGVTLNFSLAVFNMLPIPPFDGGFIAANIFPPLRPLYDAVRPFSMVIILLLINAGPILRPIFDPVDRLSYGLVLRALGENPKHWYSD
jgi:Zn-dependent protease